MALFLCGCATLEDMQKQVQQNPNDALAHIDLGSYYVGNKQYQKAITSCKEAIEVLHLDGPRTKVDYSIAWAKT